MSTSTTDEAGRAATASLQTIPRFPWSAFSAVLRTTVVVWVLLRLLLAALGLVGGVPPVLYLGGVRTSVLLMTTVVGLTLFDARRMNERVFFLNLGLTEVAVGAVSLVSALSCEILLFVGRSNLTGG
jgi:hypothetical protein